MDIEQEVEMSAILISYWGCLCEDEQTQEMDNFSPGLSITFRVGGV